jgi:hypothetical protein
MHVRIPWGAGEELELRIPPDWSVAGVHSADLSVPVSNYGSLLDGALRAAPLIRGIGKGTRVAIVVDDNSRWTPVQEALAVLLPHLHSAGVERADISISVAVGRHRAADDMVRKRLGEHVASTYRCFIPPVDNAAFYADLGSAPDHIPVRVFRPVADAGLRVLVGSVLPHLQAGFGGGWKLIFPGISHRSTLGALHRQGLSGNLGSLIGTNAADNVMRRAVRAAAQLLPGPTLSISHLLGPPGTVLQLAVGHPDEVQDALEVSARRRFEAPACPLADVVLVNNYPWPGDPMQSFKALFHHSAGCRRGGLLVGFFHTDPEEPVRAIVTGGRAGAWIIKRSIGAVASILTALSAPSAFMACWARELVADRTVLLYSPSLHHRFGTWLGPVRIFSDQAALWAAAKSALGRAPNQSVRVRIFPTGGLTYCSGVGTTK